MKTTTRQAIIPWAVLTALLTVCTQTAFAQFPNFNPPITLNPGFSILHVSKNPGDLDGDGKMEVMVSGASAAVVVTVDKDAQPGSWFAYRTMDWQGVDPAAPSPGSGVFYDMDGDGDDDLVFPEGRGVRIFETHAAGSSFDLTLHSSLTTPPGWTGSPPTSYGPVVVADFNADGTPDLAYKVSNDLFIWSGTGPGIPAFTYVETQSAYRVYDIDVGDIDADGDIDLIRSGWSGCSYLANSGSMTAPFFGVSSGVSLGGKVGTDLAIGNFDGLPGDDIAMFCNPQCCGDPGISLFRREVSGVIGAYHFLPNGDQYDGTLGDFDDDGLDDILGGYPDTHKVYRMVPGTILSISIDIAASTTTMPLSTNDNSVAWDIDHDGCLDVLGRAGSNLAIQTQQSPVTLSANPAACGSTVVIDATAWMPRPTPPTAWRFDFGDGSAPVIQTNAIASHTYTTPGNYIIKVQDGDPVPGAHNVFSTCVRLTVATGTTPPVADAGGPYVVPINSSLTLSGTGTDPDIVCGDILTLGWDLNGDGIYTDATGTSPTVDWITLTALGLGLPGTYSVDLKVTDSTGLEGFDSAQVQIGDYNFPGIGEDLVIKTSVGAVPPNLIERKVGLPNEIYNIKVTSPSGTHWESLLVLICEPYMPGSPPVGFAPGIHTSLNFTVLYGLPMPPLHKPVVGEEGTQLSLIIPPGLTGLELVVQGVVPVEPLQYAATDGHILEFL